MNFSYCLPQHLIDSQIVRTIDPASDLVVSLLLMKTHCKLPLEEDFTDDDELLTLYCKTAEGLVESHSETCLKQQTLELQLQELPRINGRRHKVRLEKTPVSSVSKVEWYSCDGELHELDAQYYRANLSATPPSVWIDPAGFNYDIDSDRMDAIKVTFVAGVPVGEGGEVICKPEAKQAILYLVGQMYQKREPVHLWTGKQLMEMPLSYTMLIDALRWRF